MNKREKIVCVVASILILIIAFSIGVFVGEQKKSKELEEQTAKEKEMASVATLEVSKFISNLNDFNLFSYENLFDKEGLRKNVNIFENESLKTTYSLMTADLEQIDFNCSKGNYDYKIVNKDKFSLAYNLMWNSNLYFTESTIKDSVSDDIKNICDFTKVNRYINNMEYTLLIGIKNKSNVIPYKLELDRISYDKEKDLYIANVNLTKNKDWQEINNINVENTSATIHFKYDRVFTVFDFIIE